MFHIKISSTLQHRGLSLPDCQGFGFHSSQDSWKSRSICTRQYCMQPDHSWDVADNKGCPWHPRWACTQGNPTCTEAWPVSLTSLGCQKASRKCCAHILNYSFVGLKFCLHLPKNWRAYSSQRASEIQYSTSVQMQTKTQQPKVCSHTQTKNSVALTSCLRFVSKGNIFPP